MGHRLGSSGPCREVGPILKRSFLLFWKAEKAIPARGISWVCLWGGMLLGKGEKHSAAPVGEVLSCWPHLLRVTCHCRCPKAGGGGPGEPSHGYKAEAGLSQEFLAAACPGSFSSTPDFGEETCLRFKGHSKSCSNLRLDRKSTLLRVIGMSISRKRK